MDGFCSISLGFHAGSGFLGWGQAAVSVHSPELTEGEFIISAVTEFIPCNMVSFVCVSPALADWSVMG